MAPAAAILSIIVERLCGGVRSEIAFLAVNDALLKGGENLRQGHRRRQRAKRSPDLQVDLVFLRADLQPLHILGAIDGPLAVGELAESDTAECQALEPFCLELGQNLLADRAIEHGLRMVKIPEEKRDVEHLNIGHEIGDDRGRRNREVDGADLEPFQHLTVATQGAAWMQADLDAPVGLRLDLLGEGRHRDAFGRCCPTDESQVQHFGLLGEGRAGRDQQGCAEHGGTQKRQDLHDVSSLRSGGSGRPFLNRRPNAS